MPFTAAQIAEQVRGEVLGDASVELTGFAPADSAKSGDLTFAEKETYFAAAEQSQAAAILVPAGFTSGGLPVGIQLVGRHRDDWSVLQLAYAFEQATQHGRRRPSAV